MQAAGTCWYYHFHLEQESPTERVKGHFVKESSYVGIGVKVHVGCFIRKILVPLYKAAAPVKYYLVL